MTDIIGCPKGPKQSWLRIDKINFNQEQTSKYTNQIQFKEPPGQQFQSKQQVSKSEIGTTLSQMVKLTSQRTQIQVIELMVAHLIQQKYLQIKDHSTHLNQIDSILFYKVAVSQIQARKKRYIDNQLAKIMQQSKEPSGPFCQVDASSRLVHSILSKYNTLSNNQSIDQSRKRQYLSKYRSNSSRGTGKAENQPIEDQQPQFLQLIIKKQSQLKTLETFLLKQFEEITQNKEKHAKIKAKLAEMNDQVSTLKQHFNRENEGGIVYQLNAMKSQMIQIMSQAARNIADISQQYTSSNKSQEQTTYLKHFIQSQQQIINSQGQQIQRLKKIIQLNRRQFQELKDRIEIYQNEGPQETQKCQEPQEFQYQEHQEQNKPQEYRNKEYNKNKEQNNNKEQNKNQGGKTQEDHLQVSFSADRNNREPKLKKPVFMIKPNQGFKVEQVNLKDRKHQQFQEQKKDIIPRQTTFQLKQLQQNKPQQQVNTRSIAHSSISISSNQFSRRVSAHDSRNEQNHSHSYQLRRVNTSFLYNNNDKQSAINKLDIFSEFNGNYQQDDLSSVEKKQNQDREYSQIEYRKIQRQKISRSMRNEPPETHINQSSHQKSNLQHQDYQNSQFQKQFPSADNKITLIVKKNQPPINSTTDLSQTDQKNKSTQRARNDKSRKQQVGNAVFEMQQARNALSKKQQPIFQLQQLQSPDYKKRKNSRYDYCRLYEKEEIKQIEDINMMCNQAIINDTTRYAKTSFPHDISNKSITTTVYDRTGKQMGSQERLKQPSPISKYSPSRRQSYKQGYTIPQNNQRTPSRSPSHMTFNKQPYQFPTRNVSKKPLTIQIQESNTLKNSNFQLPNPYYKPQNHLHQLCYQEFSPDKQDHKASNSTWNKKIAEENHPKVSENIQKDRKQYIKQKIQQIKRRNHSNLDEPDQINSSKNVLKKSYTAHNILVSENEQQQNHIARKQIQRPSINRSISRSKSKNQLYSHQKKSIRSDLKMTYDYHNEGSKGYDYCDDKINREKYYKNKVNQKTYKNQSSSQSRFNASDRSKQISRVSYSINQKSSSSILSNTPNSHQQGEKQFNNIYAHLNNRLQRTISQTSQQQSKVSMRQNQPSQKQYKRPPFKNRQSFNNEPRDYSPSAVTSPLKPSNRNNNVSHLQEQNNLYLPHHNCGSSNKKHSNSTQYHYQQQKYTEQNIYKHPYVGQKQIKKAYTNIQNNHSWYDNSANRFKRF